MTTPEIRPLTLPEVDELLGWAKAEGWNPGIADAAPFRAADQGGFFGCFSEGRMAAGISAVRYGTDFAFIGLYISHPDCRGKGFGRAVWDHAMASLDGRTIGLDGVPAQQGNYARMGFSPAYRTWRWSGRFPALTRASADIVTVTDTLLPAISAFDRRAFPAPREAFLEAWLKPPRIALALLRGDTIRGYGVLRRCHDGFKIGPLFAETPEEAERLFAALAREAGLETVAIDVPETQGEFSACLAGLGFEKGFDTARMYRGTPPRLHPSLVFGVTTLELG
ncbi:GNAT family N-acetyltransferase [Rhizobium sp. CSW-27]|uniref:GNAT family N-acetyltransferase n=1 Tax=Rhizobium sp. CSW-27 TaxID=2839985 RepID=UPI001C02F637|nr:GNAT family N-acetyltransferase [Rhizobium sp. CSW-27]MBT9369644.1 GNAT family N-acetyltransferase [Rhizobium sp. CSW-27]